MSEGGRALRQHPPFGIVLKLQQIVPVLAALMPPRGVDDEGLVEGGRSGIHSKHLRINAKPVSVRLGD